LTAGSPIQHWRYIQAQKYSLYISSKLDCRVSSTALEVQAQKYNLDISSKLDCRVSSYSTGGTGTEVQSSLIAGSPIQHWRYRHRSTVQLDCRVSNTALEVQAQKYSTVQT
jgi:hypothetical protein